MPSTMTQPDLFTLGPHSQCSDRESAAGQASKGCNKPDGKARLQNFLAGKAESIILTDNRRNMLSWRQLADGRCRIRMHHMFMDAPDSVLSAVIKMLNGDKSERPTVREYIKENRERIRDRSVKSSSGRRRTLRPRGAVCDLRDIHDELNCKYFGQRSTAQVTWGPALQKKAPRNLRFGSYNSESNVITISRRLNADDIPREVVEYIMFHEILHEILGVSRGPSGRRRMHTAEFRRRERQYHRLQFAKAFMAQRWNVKM